MSDETNAAGLQASMDLMNAYFQPPYDPNVPIYSIRANHAPFRRAGLFFGSTEPLIIPVADLPADRLAILFADPSITISISTNGGFLFTPYQPGPPA